jgi:hypothetical protein
MTDNKCFLCRKVETNVKLEKYIFTSKNGLELIVKHRKSAVIFEAKTNEKHDIVFEFSSEAFSDLLMYIEAISDKVWSGFNPKEEDSFGSDYGEYYDKELDNNGYLTVRKNRISINRPFRESEKLYQFNKRKMESFVYDFRKLVTSEN